MHVCMQGLPSKNTALTQDPWCNFFQVANGNLCAVEGTMVVMAICR